MSAGGQTGAALGGLIGTYTVPIVGTILGTTIGLIMDDLLRGSKTPDDIAHDYAKSLEANINAPRSKQECTQIVRELSQIIHQGNPYTAPQNPKAFAEYTQAYQAIAQLDALSAQGQTVLNSFNGGDTLAPASLIKWAPNGKLYPSVGAARAYWQNQYDTSKDDAAQYVKRYNYDLYLKGVGYAIIDFDAQYKNLPDVPAQANIIQASGKWSPADWQYNTKANVMLTIDPNKYTRPPGPAIKPGLNIKNILRANPAALQAGAIAGAYTAPNPKQQQAAQKSKTALALFVIGALVVIYIVYTKTHLKK